ncbi:MAG: hypothetical protein JNM14_07995 [Ferruginibacter sp.]|nr:hypothetical protein [Ferruginibacter sp.]
MGRKVCMTITISSLWILLFAAAGCRTKSDSIIPAFNNYKFDTAVIKKLPVYDSLASAISAKIGLFHKKIDVDAAYHAFRYMPASNEAEVFKTIPADIGIDVNGYFTTLGKDFIYAFDVFKDSTIKIYIRNRRLENTEVDIAEYLSYYPKETNIHRRDYPDKDTVLNKHWQYWTRFTTESLF